MRFLFTLTIFCMVAAVPAGATTPAEKKLPAVAARTIEPTAPADNVNAKSNLPTPRFVTLAVDEVNVRTGPALRYPIKHIIRRGGMPVEIVREFDVWRQIRDKDGDEGWVHKSMLSGRRSVIVKDQLRPLLKKPEEAAPPVAKLEPGVIAALETCAGAWCSLKVQSYEGWIRRDAVWGVYPDEKFQE